MLPLDPFIGEITDATININAKQRRRYRVPRHDLVAIPAKQLYKFRGGGGGEEGFGDAAKLGDNAGRGE